MSEQHPLRQGIGAEDAARALSQALGAAFESCGAMNLYRSCGNCKFMAEPPAQAYCTLYNTTPPVDVIIKGCASHADNCEIPF